MMQTLFLLFLSLLTQHDDIFIDENGLFQIFQPGEFSEKWEKIETDMGTQEVFTYFYSAHDSMNDPNALYLLNYMDYPHDFESDSLEMMKQGIYDETIASSIESLNGKLVYSEDVDMNANLGRLSRIEYNDGTAVVKSKMCIHKQRFYYVQVFTTKVNSLNKKMDRFLDSFRILEDP